MQNMIPSKQSCEHKYVYFDTSRQHGERACCGISSAKDWKRIDRFYCEKCLDIKEIVKTAEGYEDKPEWFD